MSKYIDADRLVDMLKAKADMAVGAPKTVCLSVAKMVGLLPPTDRTCSGLTYGRR